MAIARNIHMRGVALAFEGGAVPEWVQLTPAGPRLETRDGRSWTLEDPEALVTAFQENEAPLPIDIEHATQVRAGQGQSAPAAGWITEIEARDGALWGKVEWTEQGAAWVAAREYRYLSPAFAYDPETGAMKRLVSAGLTNTPALKMAALAREEDPRSGRGQAKETNMDETIREALGLKEEATSAEAVAAIDKLKEGERTATARAQQPDPKAFVPRADYDLATAKIREFEKAAEAREAKAAEAAVEAAIEAGKIAPSARDFHLAACKSQGVEAFQKMAGTLPEIAGKSGLEGKQPAQAPEKLGDEEVAVCRAFGTDPKTFASAKAKEER